MDFTNLKKQVKETIEIQKMINDIKHTLDHRIFDGYLLRCRYVIHWYARL